MIRITNITKKFGYITAVNAVNLEVLPADIVGLVGPDGAGKTTLMRMVCGLIVPDQGEVTIAARPHGPQKSARGLIGYMPQRFSLYGDLTVWENINFFASMYKIGKGEIKTRADDILQLTGLLPFTDRLADNLSGGMKQKLALTCALVIRPDILVLDEPTYGVDPQSRKEFWKILYHLNQQGITLFISTPYMDEAELCKTVAFINQGHIQALATPRQLKAGFPYQVLEVRTGIREPQIFNQLPGVVDVSFYGHKHRVVTAAIDTTLPAISSLLAGLGLKSVDSLAQKVAPTMEEVFVALAEKEVIKDGLRDHHQ